MQNILKQKITEDDRNTIDNNSFTFCELNTGDVKIINFDVLENKFKLLN